MKKLLLTLITAISFSSYGQKDGLSIVNIWEVEKDTISAGETVYIGVKYERPAVPAITDTAQIFLHNSTASKMPALWRNSWEVLEKVKKYGIDSLTKIFITIPKDFPVGDAKIYGFNTGVNNVFKVYITKKPLGIPKHNATERVKQILYYNSLGQQIQKPNEYTKGLVIEVTITDTRTTVRKLLNVN